LPSSGIAEDGQMLDCRKCRASLPVQWQIFLRAILFLFFASIARDGARRCHQIDAESHSPETHSGAPSFGAIGRVSSMTELAIKVFLQSSHPTMPNIISTLHEIDSIAAYIKSLARK
jgi:hypothetical protein